ncbi:MAG: hypothetical protein WCB58_17470, partial [Acidobacteriaceae bacterium]
PVPSASVSSIFVRKRFLIASLFESVINSKEPLFVILIHVFQALVIARTRRNCWRGRAYFHLQLDTHNFALAVENEHEHFFFLAGEVLHNHAIGW